MAHLALEYANNVPFPSQLPLLDLLAKYSSVTHTGNKDNVKLLYHEDSEFWLIRPLTQQMIEYAAEDVNVLVPQLHRELKRRLDGAKAMNDFRNLVRSEILREIDGQESYQAKCRIVWAIWRQVMNNMTAKYNERTEASSLSEDEKRVMRQLREGTKEWQYKPEVIKSLERKVVLYDLNEFRSKFSRGEKLENWEINRVKKLANHVSQDVARLANQLLSSINAPSS